MSSKLFVCDFGGVVHKCEGLMRYVHVYYYDVMELIICLTVPPVGIVIDGEGVREANLLSTRNAVCRSAFVDSPLHWCVPYSQALMSFLQV